VAQSINASGDTPVIPFQLRSALGGVELLRGYTTGRFIDYDLTAAAIEYRWPIWDVIDAFLFAEAGRVYDSLSDEFTFKNWHETFGTGLRVWNGDGVILLLQAAVGDEQTQFYFELGGEW
jgi:outer membrane protein assembly factor BamA